MKEENKTWEPDPHSSLFIEDIKYVLQTLYNQFRAVKLRNEYLEEENERLKSEAYKDEELSKMQEKYESMKADYYRGFAISEKEEKKIEEWMQSLPKANTGAIGGRFHYEFYCTSIGTIGTVVDGVTGQKFKFRDLD